MNSKYATIKKSAELMGGDKNMEEAIKRLASDKVIRSVIIKGTDIILVDIDSLWEYLDKCDRSNNLGSDEMSTDIGLREELTKTLLKLVENIGHKSIVRGRYINLYGRSSSNRVYSQLHLPKISCLEKYDGIFIVVPNGEDLDLSEYECFSTDISLTGLKGDYGPNSDWLRGNGVRGTTSPATILHLPISLLDSDKVKEWNKIENLLKLAQIKRS